MRTGRFGHLALIGVVSIALAASACATASGGSAADPQAGAWVGVTVSGHGTVTAAPDTALLDIGVQTSAATVAAAQEQAAAAANAVIASLRSHGIGQSDTRTTELAIQPQYGSSKDGSPGAITGYQVSNMLQVRIRNLSSLSGVVDSAVAAGGDATRIQQLQFKVENDAKLLEQARKAAMSDAQQKAEQLAQLAGHKLGSVLAISETQSAAPPPPLAFGGAKAALPATPIEPGTENVSVDVTVRWAIG